MNQLESRFFCGLLALFAALFALPANAASLEGTSLFGSSEELVGRAELQLSAQRFAKLRSSGDLDDPNVGKKWSIVTQLIRWQTPRNKLKLVQQFFNTMRYETDAVLYRKADYWASAAEFLRYGGDCEDFVIAKYRALTEGGFPPESLRIVLLHDRITEAAHAVLAAYLDGQILILDNQRAEVIDHREVGNYVPIYSLNESYVWRHRASEGETPLAEIEIATRGR